MRRRGWVACVAAAAAMTAAGASLAAPRSDWGEAPFRALGARDVATCLRAAGADRVTALGPRVEGEASIDLLAAGPDGLAPLGRATLGDLTGCPTVAGAGGMVLVAGAVSVEPEDPHYAIRAAVAGPDGRFGPAVQLARTRDAD